MKFKKLILCILLDIFGWASYGIPILGESIDFIWAPLSSLIMIKMFGGAKGKVAGVVTFIEEILPGSDVVPTFTLMWIYTYVLNSKNQVIKSD